jgi:hypothetical protein
MEACDVRCDGLDALTVSSSNGAFAVTDRYPISPRHWQSARSRACYDRGMVADAEARLAALVQRIEGNPHAVDLSGREAGDQLADEVGGESALRWRIALVRSLIEAPPDPDAVREAYGELVDRYRDDADALATIKPLGDEIRRREADGTLPSTLVVRSSRRKTTKSDY